MGFLAPRVAHAHGLPWSIWLTDRQGQVKRIGSLEEDEPTVAWSPDGRHLAVSGGMGVHLLEVEHGRATELLTQGGFGGIDWTP